MPTKVEFNIFEQPSEPVIKLGKSGHAVNLSANFLRLSIENDHGAFEYSVSYSPAIDHRAFKIRMLKGNTNMLILDL